jgi:hypothetical protein
MKNEYQTIKGWAVNDVADQKSRKAILRDVKDAFDKKTKKWTWFTYLYQLGEHKNLANAVNSIEVIGRVKTDTLQSCWVCGTPHNDTYHARFKGRDLPIGNVCAKEHLAKYGLNIGVLSDIDEKSAAAKADEVNNDLELLVAEGQKPVTLIANKPAKKNETFLYSQVQWVLNQKDVPDDVLQAAKLIKDTFARPGRTAVTKVLDYVENARRLPADMFEPIAKDLEHMGRSDLAMLLREQVEYTGSEAKEIWTKAGVDPIRYRIEKNTEFLRQYEPEGKSLATILEEIIPAVEHDKKLWHDDLLAQEYRFNKVLSPEDYRLVSKCLKRWAFGSTQHLQGADRLRLRNIALRIEPVEDFGKEIDGLIAIGRKLQYAKDHTCSIEQAQLKKIKEEISSLPNSQKYARIKKMVSAFSEQINDPCRLLQSKSMTVEQYERENQKQLDRYFNGLNDLVALADRSYGWGDRIWENNHPKTANIKDHIKYGVITADDAKVLGVLERRVKTYCSINSNYLKKDIRELQEGANSKLVVEMPLGKDKDTFKNADYLNHWAVKALMAKVYTNTATLTREAVVSIAAKDYHSMRSKLNRTKLTEEKVLEMKAQLKDVPEELLISGRQFRYVCPEKVREMYLLRNP